ncbi:hypothetical protein HQQ94_09585 [Shewanella sp. VB17]|uniref:phage baseplate assembly protein V n=1 Tax=Shewanella sp. VB17 TaxID=2739432 RepID=UPI0015675399|nr:phage baseplate assembly protein V [Shewanella sp. VB17]NRD73492.1 hypothetical protein [Shewanella sp. VB17]
MADYNILIGDKDITSQVISLSCFYGVNQIPELTIRMTGLAQDEADEDLALATYNLAKADFLSTGQEININAQLTTEDNPLKKLIFSGLITGQTIGIDGQSYVDIIAHGEVIKLTEGPINQLFDKKKQQDDSAIIKAILSEANISKIDLDEATKSIANQQYVIYQQTPWRGMMARILANGFFFVPTPAMNKVMAWKKAKEVHKIRRESSGIESFSLHQDSRSQIKSASAMAWAIDKQEMIAGKPGESSVPTDLIKPLTEDVKASLIGHFTEPKSAEELNSWANAQLIYRQLDRFQGQLSINVGVFSAAIKIQLMEALDLSEFGEVFSGQYVVTAIEHNITPQGWRLYITLGLHLHHSLFSDWLTPPPVPHLMGKVGNIKEGPDDMHQVPVWLPGISSGKKQVVMARLLSPHASKESGLYFLPNEDDEVVVAFVGGDSRYPVIVGATHNPINKPSESWQLTPGIYLQGLNDKGEKISSASLIFDAYKSVVLSAKEKDKPQSVIQMGTGEKGLSIATQDKKGKKLMSLTLSDKNIALTKGKDDKNSIALGDNIDFNTGGNVNIKVADKVEITS